jgi:hypothetical protein
MTFVLLQAWGRQEVPKSSGDQRPVIRFPMQKARIILEILLKPFAQTTLTSISFAVHTLGSRRERLPKVRNPVQAQPQL